MSKRSTETNGEGTEMPVQTRENKRAAPSEFPMTVEEFCAQLSSTEKRVEMIGAFHSDEKRHGRIKDTRTAYLKRFDEFCKRPV